MSIPQALVDKTLADCGRRCCICRRFAPLHLQVHHIKPREEGGKDVEDNLIAICLTCHADVHTGTKLTRRFTKGELKLHKKAVVAAVRDGRLEVPPDHSGIVSRVAEALVASMDSSTSTARTITDLPAHAVELLLACAQGDGDLFDTTGDDVGTTREAAKQRDAFEILAREGLIRFEGGLLYKITYAGYELADQLLSAGAKDSEQGEPTTEDEG